MTSMFGQVEPWQQTTAWSCGAAVLKAVLQHYGERVPEPVLMREVGVKPKSGSTAEQVAKAARKRGYNATVKQFKSFDELESYTNRDVPVIVAIRSFKTPDQGHFVVATGVGRNQVKLMDPNVDGNRRVISRNEMARRWKFRDHVGVIVTPKRPSNGFGNSYYGFPQLGIEDEKKLEPKHYFTLAIVGGFILFSIFEAGMFIYRRRAA